MEGQQKTHVSPMKKLGDSPASHVTSSFLRGILFGPPQFCCNHGTSLKLRTNAPDNRPFAPEGQAVSFGECT